MQMLSLHIPGLKSTGIMSAQKYLQNAEGIRLQGATIWPVFVVVQWGC